MVIRKLNNKYVIYSRTSHRRFGVFPNKTLAKAREKQINYFKVKNMKGGKI